MRYLIYDSRPRNVPLLRRVFFKIRNRAFIMSKTYRIVVSGYYGCGNAGDEAVLAGIRASFARTAGAEAQIVALSQNPEETARLHNIPAHYRMSLKTLNAALQNGDVLLSGGGSLLQDSTSVRSLLYYLWVCHVAMRQGVPVVFYAQGLGPLNHRVSRTSVRWIADRCALITVRDPASAELLKKIGVRNPNIEITADPAFALNPAPATDIDALMDREGLPRDKPLLGAALRAWGRDAEAGAKSCAALLEAIREKTGLPVVLIPMHAPHDAEFGDAVLRHVANPDSFFAIRNAYPPEALLGLVARLEGVVAMRLHALIFAARVGVPAFALSYDPKVEALMRGLGMEDFCAGWEGFDAESVAERAAGMLAEREKHARRLQSLAPQLEAKALLSAERVMETLRGKRPDGGAE